MLGEAWREEAHREKEEEEEEEEEERRPTLGAPLPSREEEQRWPALEAASARGGVPSRGRGEDPSVG
jgi:hypothetical protein